MTALLRWLYTFCHRRGWLALAVAVVLAPASACTLIYSIDAPGSGRADAGWLLDDSGEPILDDGGNPVLQNDAAIVPADADPAAPDAFVSQCDLYAQTGCGGLEACYPADYDTGAGQCLSAGFAEQGQPCTLHEQCAAGSFCDLYCRRLCATQADCEGIDANEWSCTPMGNSVSACSAGW